MRDQSTIPPALPDEIFLAWLAGFIDGEGCFTILQPKVKGYTNYRPLLVLSNVNPTPLQDVRSILGFGRVHPQMRREARSRPAFQYHASGDDAIRIAQLVRPYLRIKGPQADIIAGFPSATPTRNYRPVSVDTKEQRRLCRVAIQALNVRGVATEDS